MSKDFIKASSVFVELLHFFLGEIILHQSVQSWWRCIKVRESGLYGCCDFGLWIQTQVQIQADMQAIWP